MTEKQALTAARKLFGKNAALDLRCPGGYHGDNTRVVGVIAMGAFFLVKGDGPNWAAAIDNAKERLARDRAEYEALAAQ